MAEKKSANKIMLAVVAGVVVLFIVILSSKGGNNYKAMDHLPQYAPESVPEDGDSQADTIRALQAYAKEAVGKAEALNARAESQATTVLENRNHVEKLTLENEDLKTSATELKKQAQALAKQLGSLQKELDSVKDQQKDLQPKTDEHGIPVGFGYDHLINKKRVEEGQWHNPVDQVIEAEGKGNNARFQGLLAPPGQRNGVTQETPSHTTDTNSTNTHIKPTIDQRYTLPKDSVLYDGVAMTALIGRIPVEGTTPDPYPVKIFVGAENLAANGHQLPDVKGMIFSGWGIGDWNLSCVSARLHSATYIFEDGRIVNHTSEGKALGYISDRYGWPCVNGDFKTNAPKFLSQRIGLAAVGAAGAAYSDAQFSKRKSELTGSLTSDLTGDISKVIGGTVVKSATDEASAWLLARQRQSFDAVIVKPGELVSIHLDTELALDHAELARKVSYEHNGSQPLRTLD